ncbi:MAG: HAD family hydrolase [Candidatus Dormibacteraeota bacterium]|nr:HAD family hydrolase [Candidatus Dormibacteraeota bacterium]
MIRAVIFDFDGVIVETEQPLFRVWQRIYRERGAELPTEQWLSIIGTAGALFDPIVDLGRRSGRELNREEMEALERAYYREAVATQQLLPGVRRYLDEAWRLDLKTAIASSSRRPWIDEHLERMGIRSRFDVIVCRDDVTRVKPDPELYLKVLRRLGLAADEAIAIEDSSNGLRAAKGAGLYCVAVPTPMTASMDLGLADLRLYSLEDMPLTELTRRPSSAR